MDVLRVCTVRPNINVDGCESSDGLSATFLNQLFQIQANGINRAMFDLLMVEDFGCPVPRQCQCTGIYPSKGHIPRIVSVGQSDQAWQIRGRWKNCVIRTSCDGPDGGSSIAVDVL